MLKRDEAGRRLLSGNEAIARGAWEAGVVVAAGYPGTPSTEILEALTRHPEVSCEWSPNEKVALEVALGAALAGGRALAAMKHVGLNVAADPFFAASYTGVNGGLVVVTADDPGMHSSQDEQDNRLLARAARVPLLEPATPEEARVYAAAAFDLSERHDTPVLLRTTTRLSHGSGEVWLGRRWSGRPRPYRKDRSKHVLLPAHARGRHRWIEEERFPGLAAEAEEWAEVFDGPGELAIITAGVPFLYVREAFPDAPVLKLGITYPVPAAAIRRFAAGRSRVVVVEELEPYLEEQVRALGVPVEPRRLPSHGELSVDALRRAYGGNGARPRPPSAPRPPRPPALCPGCSHRGSFHALRRLGAIVAGDIGCYTLGALPPLDAMDTCACMGASIGMAHGMAKVLPEADRRRVVAVIGDSTFFHSGINGLADVVYNGGTSKVLVLDNRTTAMTGHQGHPGTGLTLAGREVPPVDIAALSRALGVEDVRPLDPYDLIGAWRTLDGALRKDGPSVVLAEAPCVLAERVDFGPPVALDPDRCTDCFACTRLGCPAIVVADGRLAVDAALCNGCGMCPQVCADCNAGIDVPLMLELVARGRFAEAVASVLRSSPIPATAARVCPHPCDHETNALGREQGRLFAELYPGLVHLFPAPGGRLSIREVERFVGDWALEHGDPEGVLPPAERTARIAIIGSGPAGLSAAWQLRRRGYRPTVVEAADAPGGMLRHGIPAFRLPREVLAGELARLERAGIELRCGVRVGTDISFDRLAAGYDAVIVAAGAWAPAPHGLEGADDVREGVLEGLEFLRRFNAGEPLDPGRRVAVVGGGNTAMDCARAAARLGAEATVLYRRTEAELPAIPDEVEDARRDGVSFRFQTLPAGIRAVDGRLRELLLVRTRQGPPDESGRRRPEPVPGSETAEAFDTLILAIGERPALEFLEGAGVDRNGRIAVGFAGTTSRPGVFACGDAAFGHGTVTQAIATGRRAAEAAAEYLERKGA